MSFLHITYFTVLRNIRDWKFIVLFILAPLVLFLVTTNATSGFEKIKIEKVKAAYFDADGGPVARQLGQFLQSKETLDAFDIQKVESLDEGKQMVREGKLEALIYVGKDFSASIEQGKQTKLELHSSKSNSQTRLLVESFIDTLNAFSAIKTLGGDIKVSEVLSGIEQIALSPTGKTLKNSAKFPYLGGMNALFLGALLGSLSVIMSIKKNTLLRLNVSPINRFAYVSGQLLGNFLTLFGSSSVMIGYTYFVIGSYGRENILSIILAFLLFTATITALGMSAAYLTKNTGLSVLIVVCLMLFLGNAAIAGAIGTANGFFKWVLNISPQYYTYLIVTDTIFDGPASRIQSSVISMAIFASVLIALTLFLGRRKPA